MWSMNEVEKMLEEEKRRLQAERTPPELENRLRQALNKTPKQPKKPTRSPFLWKTLAAILVLSLLINYNYPALAYYGKKILGFDEITSGTLQELNEVGMGQVVDKQIEWKKGITFEVNGVMTDENRLIMYYTMSSEHGNIDDSYSDLIPSKLFGWMTSAQFENGSGEINEAGTEIKGTFNFESPSPFAKKLTLHFRNSEKELTFGYDPSKAMETIIKQKINQEIKVDGGWIRFDTITASPTMTVIKGKSNVEEIGRISEAFSHIKLLANGEEVETQGGGHGSSIIHGYDFNLNFDALPPDLTSLQLNVEKFIGYDQANEQVGLEKGTKTSISGEELFIKNINVTNEQTEVTIVTDHMVLLDQVAIENNDTRVELKTTVNQTLEKQENGIEKERTLLFDTTEPMEKFIVGGIYYMKDYNETIEIPVE